MRHKKRPFALAGLSELIAPIFFTLLLPVLAPQAVLAATGTIGASPNPCTVTTLGGKCSLTLSWSTSGASAAQVWVTDAVGNQVFIASGLSGSQVLDWIEAEPQHYTFQLYQYSGSTRGALLSSVNVSVPSPQLSLDVQPTGSQSFNHGQTMNFTITVREPSGNPVGGANVAIQDGLQGGVLQNVTTNASGQATYGYIVPTLVAPGTYTLTFGPATKSGYRQSGTTSRQVTVNAPPSTLTLSVTPSGTQTVNPGQPVSYSITVTDSSGNGVSGVTVPVANPLTSNTSLTTSAGGVGSYSFTVPSGATSGTYTLAFGNASKSGYISSGIVQRTVAVNAPQPFLTLAVSPTALQSVSAGQTANYAITVQDGSGTGVSGATVTVTNPFSGTNSAVTTGAGGAGSYSLSVPSSQGAATYTVFFSGASKSGYTSSSGTSRQVTVQPATGPTAVLSLSAQGQTASNGGTLMVSATTGGSVNVSFSAAASTAGSGTITSYAWTSNGNSIGSGEASFSMAFGTPSNDIALTVTNSFGLTSTATARIVVNFTPSSTLSLDVQPTAAQTVNQSATITFTITVRDSGGAAVSGANVAIQDGLQGGVLQNVTTNASGQATYGYIVPTLVTPGTYTLTFGPATKTGYNQSGTANRQVTVNAPPSTLTLNVTSSGTQTVDPGQPVSYSITVTDSSGNGVSGVTVPVANPLTSNTSLTTGAGGAANYSFTVPSGAASGTYTVSFGNASKSGYTSSGIVQRTVAVSGPQPFLTLAVSPTALQSVSAGQTANYAITVQDGSGTGVSGATVTVTNPFSGTNSAVTTGAGGAGSYSLSVPSSQGAATYTVFFSGASKSGYTSSSGTSRQVTVQPGSNVNPPSGALTANPSTCQVSAGARTCTITLIWSAQNVTAAQIWVTDVNNVEQPVTTGTTGRSTLTWIEALPQRYVFHLWDYSTGSRGAELKTLAVSATKAAAQTSSIGVNPARGSKGDSFTIFGSGLASGAATIWSKLQNGSPATLGTATVNSEGSFSFTYKSASNIAAGTYEFYAIDSAGKQSSSAFLSISDPLPATTNGTNTTHSGTTNDPINTATGNYVHEHTDLTIPGRGMPFAFSRFYNSQDGTPGPLGAGWTHSYMASLTVNPADQAVTMRLPDGKLAIFDSAGGAYVSRYKSVFSKLESSSAGAYVLTTKSLMVYRFSNGRLTEISDRNNNKIQLSYSGNNLTRVTDTVGRQISLGYDGAGRITSLADTAGRTVRYEYDGAGNLVAFTDARGGRFTYSYDGAHRMLTAVDPENNTYLTNTYDSAGRAISQSDGAGNQWTYAYDTTTLTTTITDPNGRVSSHVHDSTFQLLRATDSLGKSDEYQYNDLGNRVSVKNRNGSLTRFNYDTSGNIIAMIDPQSRLQSASYDAQNNPLSRTDASGNTTLFSYDARGNLVKTRDVLGSETSLAYDNFGHPILKTDAEGRTTRYSYDNTGNLVEVTDPLGNKTRHTYDPLGRRVSTVDAKGFITTFVYDANNNLVSVTDSNGNKIQYAYDGNNNRIRITDQRGKATAFSYDGNYQLVTTTDALGNKITNAYDKLRNLVGVTDQLGNVTRYSYDSENRLIATTGASGKVARFEYDANGNRTKVTDPLGNSTAFFYDSLNRLVSAKDALGSEAKTEYDELGRVVKRTDPAGNATSYSYDALSRQTIMQDAAGGRVLFAYDKVGNRTSITDTRGKVTQFAYDGLNRQVAVTDPLGNVTRSEFDAVGNLTKLTDGNGNTKAYQYDGNRRTKKVAYSTGGSIQFEYDAAGNRTRMVDLVGESTYGYDDLNRLVSYKNPSGAALGLSYDAASGRTAMQYPGSKQVQYTFDANRRITKVRDWNGFEATYSYDAAGRLERVTYSNGVTSQYTYDAVGQNLRIEHRNATGVLYSEATTWSSNGTPTSSDISGLSSPELPSENATHTYNDANQLATSTYGSPAHDRNGNLTLQPEFGGATRFTYDLNNRATSIAGPEVNATMRYLGDGKLAELNTPNAPRRFLTDPVASGNRILAEVDATGGMQTGYAYGPMGMLSQISGGQTYTYLHNLQGSTVALVDAAGNARNNYRYDPFGRSIESSSEQLSIPFTFLGAFSVPSTGQFSITTYRAYDVRSGRFTGPDPATASFPNLAQYIYANQSPLGLFDASGLSAIPIGAPLPVTAGSTPASLLDISTATAPSTLQSPIDASDVADILTKIGEKLEPAGWKLVPAGPGAWRIVESGTFKTLATIGDVVSLVDLASKLGIDIWQGDATLASIWKATGEAAGCAVLSNGTFGLGCPVFKLSFEAGNALFAPGKPLDSVIQGGTVGGVYVPGLGDFTKDVILDPAQTVGGWFSRTWRSVWQ